MKKKEKKPRAKKATVTAAAADGTATAVPAVETRPLIARGHTPRAQPISRTDPHLSVLTWNVNGLRSMFRKADSVAAFRAMMERERPHCLMLQEIKVRRACASVHFSLAEAVAQVSVLSRVCSAAARHACGGAQSAACTAAASVLQHMALCLQQEGLLRCSLPHAITRLLRL